MATSLWFVVFIFGHAGVIFGPLPYDMDECQRRLTTALTEADKSFGKNGPVEVDGKPVVRKDTIFNFSRFSKFSG